MVGLSVILEKFRDGDDHFGAKITCPQVVVSKETILNVKPPPPLSPSSVCGGGFLERCFLCHSKLLPSNDIYMYKGDRGFCSEECRCRQILIDDEQELQMMITNNNNNNNNNSAAAAASAKTSRRDYNNYNNTTANYCSPVVLHHQAAANNTSPSSSRSRRGPRTPNGPTDNGFAY